ncbi:hypothetical protein DFH11DRAFT_517081 [Phellopilus nigrolimitatus]|nr:hypothetical protein DFH11DRAFT_517081 [Phellopilus nigrolimitatus]
MPRPRPPARPLALLLALLPLARASVFVTHPYAGITCHAGAACVVSWADDGQAPLLAAVGAADIALYEGVDTLVQQIAAGLDVSQANDISFTPSANAGPNSDSYFVRLTSRAARDPNNTAQPYTSYSGQFTLDGMSGSAGAPVASLTSSPAASAAASSLAPSASSNGVVSTTTLPGTAPSGTAFSASTLAAPTSTSGSGSASRGGASSASASASGASASAGASSSSARPRAQLDAGALACALGLGAAAALL